MDMEKLVALCRRRGFIFQSSEIYGGINGFWDYGPLGVELKREHQGRLVAGHGPQPAARARWAGNPDGRRGLRHHHESEGVGGERTRRAASPTRWSIARSAGPACRADKVLVRRILSAAGADCGSAAAVRDCCGGRQPVGGRAGSWTTCIAGRQERESCPPELNRDRVFSALKWRSSSGSCPCPDPKGEACQGVLTEPRSFNLMFESYAGAVKDDASKVYLRPETAQGIFVNFRNVLDSTRLKLPFGIAQIGKAFRNEINPRNYTFRSREFEQMEIEFFCHPDESMKWYQYWRDLRIRWYTQLGIKSDKLRPREQARDELAHYSIGTTDIEYLFPFADGAAGAGRRRPSRRLRSDAARASTAARTSPTSTKMPGTSWTSRRSQEIRSVSKRKRPNTDSCRT